MYKGEQLIQLAKKHIGEPYILGSIAPKGQANYQGPWDCAEFISWVVYQLTGKLYGCVNNGTTKPNSADSWTGFMDRDAHTLGKIIEVENAVSIPGACLMRVAADGKTGHIVFCEGYGGTVEAHSHKDGVIHSTVNGRRWDYGLLIFPDLIEYKPEHPPHFPTQPEEKIYRYTKPMMKDPEIVMIQMKLGIPTDGLFGPGTFQAVKGFQTKHGLVADGEVGPKTMRALGLV